MDDREIVPTILGRTGHRQLWTGTIYDWTCLLCIGKRHLTSEHVIHCCTYEYINKETSQQQLYWRIRRNIGGYIPREYKSERKSTITSVLPVCSGLIYSRVPSIFPTCEFSRREVGEHSSDIPKSMRVTTPVC